MEVAPEYWQNPETLKDIYVSTSGGAVSGAQATAAVTSTVSTTPTTASLTGAGATLLDPSAAVRNQRTNAIADSGRGTASTGAAVSTAPETMVPLSAVAHYEPGTTPLGVNHQGLFVATHDLVQPDGGQDAERRRGLRERHDARDRRAGHASTARSRARRAPSSNRSTASS